MNTNMMELNLNEMEMVNGGSTTDEKLMKIKTVTGLGAAGGAGAGAFVGSVFPVVGTAVGTVVGATVGATIAGGIETIRVFFFDD